MAALCITGMGATALTLLLAIQVSAAADYTIHTFEKIRLTDEFWAEGVAIGDG